MKKYEVTTHAVERACERLGKQPHEAAGYLNQLIQTAEYQGDSNSKHGEAMIFDHRRSKTRIIVSKTTRKIVTCYRLLPTSIPQQFREAMAKELRKATRSHTQVIRAIELEIAELELQAAQLSVSHARAKSPITRKQIAGKISILKAKSQDCRQEAERRTADYEQMNQAAVMMDVVTN